MRSSRLPAVKLLSDFDFTFQPSIRREQIESLHELGFVERCENVIFLGPPGVDKTHLATGQQGQVDFARFRFPWGVRYALLETSRNESG